MISIECRAYDQLIKHNSQEAIGLVHFEVRKSLLLLKVFHTLFLIWTFSIRGNKGFFFDKSNLSLIFGLVHFEVGKCVLLKVTNSFS